MRKDESGNLNSKGLAQFRGENGGFVSVELSKDYHGDG
jgi:hypothetical protein